MNMCLHKAGTAPSWLEAQDSMLWIQEVLQNSGISVFFITNVRESRDWAVSAFNYICGGGRYEVCGGKHTARNLLTTMRPNPQCNYYLYGWIGWKESRSKLPPTEEECMEVGNSLRFSMHYVGQTSKLEDTMCFLRSVGVVPKSEHIFHTNSISEKGLKHKRYAASGFQIVKIDDLTSKELHFIDNITAYDRNFLSYGSSSNYSAKCNVR